jgi:eukaryotic-like serine/threonine-protein kinase
MANRTKNSIFMIALILLLLPFLSSCGSSTTTPSNQHTATPGNQHIATPGDQTPQPLEVVLSSCQDRAFAAPVNTVSPSPTQRSLYFGGASGNLYALNAQIGKLRWCIHASVTGGAKCTRPIGCFPPPFVTFGTPKVADGIVYVCASGSFGYGYTYAFNSSNGSIRWRTKTDCWIVSIPFGDNATPLVNNGIVYSGTYALRAQDGHILWRSHPNVAAEGEYILLALVDGVIYGDTEGAVYAMNALDGSIRWHYPPKSNMAIGGPLVVSNQMLFVGTQGSVDQPETSALYALNAQNGSLRWYYLMGDYAGAALVNNVVYVSSRDQYLYAFNTSSGKVMWRHKFIYPAYNPALAVNGILYINIDGAYALQSTNGSVLWHKSLGSSQSVDFIPSVVIDGVDYLASTDGGGNSTLYALNASNGEEYWHIPNINQISPLTVV